MPRQRESGPRKSNIYPKSILYVHDSTNHIGVCMCVTHRDYTPLNTLPHILYWMRFDFMARCGGRCVRVQLARARIIHELSHVFIFKMKY